ncbi:acyl-CoA dehydrogenase family protein [Pseudonocardia sp.]|uniref:acyl-CoA dehydrogenase family protein n=1 Tax=Pseudonocardia sp. TaxID=60912 RepID=UPI003D114F42
MDFSISASALDHLERVRGFMSDHVYPAEPVYAAQREELTAAGRPHDPPAVMLDLIAEARAQGLWNLFRGGAAGLAQVDYAILAEQTGRSPFIAPAAMNCLSPDSGNMDMLDRFATDRQRTDWLEPLLDGEIRSAFSMTEPDVASSDATNIDTRIVEDGDHYIVNGRKWFTTGAADPRCRLLILLGRSHPDAPRHRQHTMLLVPRDAEGVRIVRALPVFGYRDQQGHCEIEYNDVRVPREYVLGQPGRGFQVAQARLGPGRVHHCMRAIGMAERALEMMVERAQSRVAFGAPLSDQGVVRSTIARSRIEIDQARLLVLHTAWLVDRYGVDDVRASVSAIKVVAPEVAQNVLDRAIQLFGGMGVTDDTPLAEIWSRARTLRIVDGPEDVHLRTVARSVLAGQPAHLRVGGPDGRAEA